MIPILTDLRNAYEAHDRDAFERHLVRLEQMLRYVGPTPVKQMCEKHDVGQPCQFCASEKLN